LLVLAVVAMPLPKHQHDVKVLTQFAQFQAKYNKEYTTAADWEHAVHNFETTLTRVEANNARLAAQGNEQVYGISKFADLSPMEFKNQYLRAIHNEQTAIFVNASNVAVVKKRVSTLAAPSFDWRNDARGVVSPVKDQGACGSCWAFAATESIESQYMLLHAGQKVKLSPEQITDCDTVDGGCDGGDTVTAFQYVTKAGGLEAESSYPYTAGNGKSGKCKFDKTKVVAKINNSKWGISPCTDKCNSQSLSAMQTALPQIGPFAVCVYADLWQDYITGVFSDSKCVHAYNDLDHCVQMVGFNNDGARKYWIVRNSWNTDWGVNGYIYLDTSVANGNLCGVLDEVNYAVAL